MGSTQSLEQFIEAHRATIERLYSRSGAQRWGLAVGAFAEALFRSFQRRSASPPPLAEDRISDFLESLYCEDLALAAACLQGVEAAWREFIARYRPAVEDFARALLRDLERAQEIADSLWADLYGLRETGGKRASPLLHYHGRSALKSWLHAVVARRAADTLRAERLHAPLDAVANHAGHGGAPAADPDRAILLPALSGALHQSIAALEPKDRLRLSYYYVQLLTLAEIAALLGEHESTVSRNLARVRAEIRRAVERALRRNYRLSEDQIRRCFDYAVEDWPFDLGRALLQAK
jgi:RNA polymerase sigma-70 factor